MSILGSFMEIFLEAAPWLLLGFVCAGLIKTWLPEGLINRWLGGEGIWSVTKAALIGTPLPLCSCGVLPAAASLRRSGASQSSTVSFLIATPETGVDSIALSYALLGPVMAVIRPLAAIISAIFTGTLTLFFRGSDIRAAAAGNHQMLNVINDACSHEHCQDPHCTVNEAAPPQGFVARTLAGLRYGLVDMVDDLVVWLVIGLLLAAAVKGLMPPMMLAEWGSGLPAMLLMLLIGIPTYICATASTPVAAALLLAGVSPGTVLVFLLAGPATNIATMGIIHKEMGKGVLITYLSGICASSITLGLLTDALLRVNDIDVFAQISAGSEWMPTWVSRLSGAILLAAFAFSLAKMVRCRFSTASSAGA